MKEVFVSGLSIINVNIILFKHLCCMNYKIMGITRIVHRLWVCL